MTKLISHRPIVLVLATGIVGKAALWCNHSFTGILTDKPLDLRLQDSTLFIPLLELPDIYRKYQVPTSGQIEEEEVEFAFIRLSLEIEGIQPVADIGTPVSTTGYYIVGYPVRHEQTAVALNHIPSLVELIRKLAGVFSENANGQPVSHPSISELFEDDPDEDPDSEDEDDEDDDDDEEDDPDYSDVKLADMGARQLIRFIQQRRLKIDVDALFKKWPTKSMNSRHTKLADILRAAITAVIE